MNNKLLAGTVSVSEILRYVRDDCFLTCKQAAAFTRLSKRELLNASELIHYNPTGRKILFKKSELVAWIENSASKKQKKLSLIERFKADITKAQ